MEFSLLAHTIDSAHYVWEDRETLLNVPAVLLNMRHGEVPVASSDDVKLSNKRHKGLLVLTTLRITWHRNKRPGRNISIGYNTITHKEHCVTRSQLKGNTEELTVHVARYGHTFAFTFTTSFNTAPKVHKTLSTILTAYEATRLFRDVRMRSAIVRNQQPILLTTEQIVSTVHGVWNHTSNEEGSLGVLVVTTHRLVWFASVAETFNVSVPFLQINRTECTDVQFGRVLVIATSRSYGPPFTVWLRVDSVEKMEEICTELSKLVKVFTDSPKFGVETNLAFRVREKTIPEITDEDDKAHEEAGGEGTEEGGDEFVAYLMSQETQRDKDLKGGPVFSTELGLAIEPLPAGVTLRQLWEWT